MNSPTIRSLAVLLLWTVSCSAAETEPGVPPFEVRPGYRVTVAAENFGREARFLEIGDDGTLYVSQPGVGAVVSLKDKDGDGLFETRAQFVTGKRSVHGLHFADGWLWFAQTRAIHKGRDTNGDGVADEVVTVVEQGALPSGGGHWYRSICVTTDGFYTSIGDSGNISDETDTERQKIWRFTLDGKSKKLFASGLRNNEKLRIRPGTNELWGADHGSDWYGRRAGDREGKQPVTDLNPPCEFNHYVDGGFYGHPFVVGNKLPRLEFLDRKDINDLAERTIPPAWSFGAHWAPNGWTFLTKDYFPDHAGDAVVACHGSWNSGPLVGYRVERVLFDKVTGLPFGGQWLVKTLKDGDVLARPVDVVEAPDGTILFTDNQVTKKVYRISKAPSR